jgi:hypothetical protein
MKAVVLTDRAAATATPEKTIIRVLVFALEPPIHVETLTLVRRGARRTSFAAIAGFVLDRPLEQWLGPRALGTFAHAYAGASALKCRIGIGAGRGP